MRKSSRNGFEAQAPHVDREWADDLVLELRLRGASGSAIGAALLEVESHMAEHGGQVADVFGDSKDYAGSLDLPDAQQWSASEVLRLCVKGALWILACYLLATGLLAFGGDARLSVLSISALLLADLLVLVVLIFWSEPVLRFLLDHVVVSVVAITVLVMAIAIAAAALPGPVLVLPPAAPIAISLVALCAIGVMVAVERRAGATLDDPVTFPGDGGQA